MPSDFPRFRTVRSEPVPFFNGLPAPQAVVFDLDGLMVNTEVLHQEVGAEILSRRGCKLEGDLVDAMMGRPAAVALDMMIRRYNLADSVETLAAEAEEIFPALLESRLALMPGLEELLAALEAAGRRKAVATSSSRGFTLGVLSRFSLVPRFEFILTAEDVRQGKPHPEIYLQAARRFGMPPAQMLVLEDSHNGCTAAVASGAVAVAVPAGRSRRHEFPGAALVAASLADPRLYEVLGLPARP